MPTDIKPGQVWKDRRGEARVRVLEATDTHVHYVWAGGARIPGMKASRYLENFRENFELAPVVASHGLKKGDKVRYVADYNPAHSHNIKKGDVREVAEVTHVGHVILTPVPGDTMHPRYTFGQNSFTLVPAGPDPAKVKAGDTITLEKGTAKHIDQVTGVDLYQDGDYRFKSATSPTHVYRVGEGAWTLTDHQPAPEKTPREQVVDILINYSNSRADDYDTADQIMAALGIEAP